MISKKICLVGDFGVGKTSLIRRFVDRQFSDQYLSTVGVKISSKVVSLATTQIEKNTSLKLLIWDLEGHTKFKAIAPSYLQGASGAIVVADVTRQETIDNLAERLELFFSINPQSLAILALNKSDLVDAEIINQLLLKFNNQEDERVIATYNTSAKTGENVDDIFDKLSYRIMVKTA
ncbi:small GTP-binding protein [Hydrocoleum sp. CS-953]|uniref:Rab family GTPase n=1 Tax=Hydrocoleum sp. CS-953 TaxID=1671698 RepID=UPI000B9C1629|nr:Rab family GTPase [Hydrocoleum sp. CS-953]OZH52348.1 small GTP-binding protein [Hydrocoleum sp. CS-953]